MAIRRKTTKADEAKPSRARRQSKAAEQAPAPEPAPEPTIVEQPAQPADTIRDHDEEW